MTPPVSIQREELNLLRDALKEATGAINNLNTQLAVHNTEQKQIQELVMKHEHALYGQDKDLGYLARFEKVEEAVFKTLKSIDRGLWIVAASVLGGVGTGLVLIVKSGIEQYIIGIK